MGRDAREGIDIPIATEVAARSTNRDAAT